MKLICRKSGRAVAAIATAVISMTHVHAAPDLSYLESVRAATSQGGWSKVSTGLFSDAWVNESQRPANFMNPSSIVNAWNSMAWDPVQGQMVVWGGGHANYMGNEIYLWSGSSGTWSRGSLPSALTGPLTLTNPDGSLEDRHYFVTDRAAPQSAHNYDNNVFLRQNNMFMTFGGATFQSGMGSLNYDPLTGLTQRAGPWMWDPTKANPNLTGGISGSLYDQFTGGQTSGGQMWLNRADSFTAASDVGTGNHINGTTAYRVENNRDVVYVTVSPLSNSGYRSLYRYEVGENVRAGDLDSMTLIGESSLLAPASQAVATLDTKNNLYVHTVAFPGYSADLGIWDISSAAQLKGASNLNIPIELVLEDGTPFEMTNEFAIDYDEANQRFTLWDARFQGLVWATEAQFDAAGGVLGTWTIRPLFSTSADQPAGALPDGTVGASPFTGVQGKWKYVPELNIYLTLNEFNTVAQDAEVWLYRPMDRTVTGAGPLPLPGSVPAPATLLLLMTGLVAVAWGRKRGPSRQ